MNSVALEALDRVNRLRDRVLDSALSMDAAELPPTGDDYNVLADLMLNELEKLAIYLSANSR